jgi:hypothetical protein
MEIFPTFTYIYAVSPTEPTDQMANPSSRALQLGLVVTEVSVREG